MNYIFDVDGTLTPSRNLINPEFGAWFESFATHNTCYWVTGSPKYMTERQLGSSIYRLAVRAYQCSGADVWDGDTNIQTSDWTLPDLARKFLMQCWEEEDFSEKVEECIHERPGMINYSMIGSKATNEQRQVFIDWEKHNDSRKRLADAFNLMFSDMEATIGGETGVDIGPKGSTKAQILSDFDDISQITFFGDKTGKGGNDHEIAKGVIEGNGIVYAVNGWEDTWRILKEQ